MIDRVIDLLTGVTEEDGAELVLLNLACKLKDHSTIQWTLADITQFVKNVERDLDDLEV